jgi:hypothetical protein
MMKPIFWCLVLVSIAITADAAEFPLTYRTIPAAEVMSFPGGYGATSQLRPMKPSALKREPKPVSRHPLYGDFHETPGGPGFLARLDESKGDGKGYDQLIVDMNQNGDLTDDAVVSRVVLPGERRLGAQPTSQVLFGPIQAPAGKMIAGGRPVYFAQAYISMASFPPGAEAVQNLYAGQLRLRAGWYLETTVDVGGLKQKVGVFDGDSNLRLGDVAQPQTYTSGGETMWFFRPGDNFLVDANGSGRFERDAFDTKARPFGPLLYFGAVPYKVTLTPDNKALRIEAWTGPLAEVVLQPHGDQVRSVTLAREQADDQWQLLCPGVVAGRIKVPPGNYRLSSAVLASQAGSQEGVMVSAFQRTPKEPFSFVQGKANQLRCGAPLDVKVTADKRTPASWERPGTAPKRSTDSDFVLTINATVRGGDGEIYAAFNKTGKGGGVPPKPAFTVTDAAGKKLVSGNLEFG